MVLKVWFVVGSVLVWCPHVEPCHHLHHNEVSMGTSVLIFMIFNQNYLLWSGETPCHRHSINVPRVGADLLAGVVVLHQREAQKFLTGDTPRKVTTPQIQRQARKQQFQVRA